MRTDDQRLRLVVADHADAAGAPHFLDILLELGPELRVGDVVDVAHELVVKCGHAARAGAEMRVVVGAVEQVEYTVLFRSYAKETAHAVLPSACPAAKGRGKECRRSTNARAL